MVRLHHFCQSKKGANTPIFTALPVLPRALPESEGQDNFYRESLTQSRMVKPSGRLNASRPPFIFSISNLAI